MSGITSCRVDICSSDELVQSKLRCQIGRDTASKLVFLCSCTSETNQTSMLNLEMHCALT